MEHGKGKMMNNLENSISAFEKITKARSLRLAFKRKLSLDDFIILKTLGILS